MIEAIFVGVFVGIALGLLCRWINETLVRWDPPTEPPAQPEPPFQVPMVRTMPNVSLYDWAKETEGLFPDSQEKHRL